MDNGLIVQWGTAFTGVNYDRLNISFNVPFPHACLVVEITQGNHMNTRDYNDYSSGVGAWNNTSFILSGQNSGGKIYWIALGY